VEDLRCDSILIRGLVVAFVEFSRSGFSFEIIGDQTLLEFAETLGISIPYACRQSQCGTCATRLLQGSVTMETEDGLSENKTRRMLSRSPTWSFSVLCRFSRWQCACLAHANCLHHLLHLIACQPLQEATEFDENLFPSDSRALNPEEVVLQNHNGAVLRKALEMLPTNFREVLILRELEECPT